MSTREAPNTEPAEELPPKEPEQRAREAPPGRAEEQPVRRPRPIDDTVALDRIHAVLDAQVWGPDTLDDIVAIVASTGREVRDPVSLYPDDFGEDE